MANTIDRNDTSYDLITMSGDQTGEVFAAQMASEWNENGDCVGGKIIAYFGPVDMDEIGEVNGILNTEQVEHIKSLLSNCDSSNTDLNWANEQNWVNVGSSV